MEGHNKGYNEGFEEASTTVNIAKKEGKMKTNRWFDVYDNVTALGRSMVDAGCITEELQEYYEKPWKYDKEWETYQQELEENKV